MRRKINKLKPTPLIVYLIHFIFHCFSESWSYQRTVDSSAPLSTYRGYKHASLYAALVRLLNSYQQDWTRQVEYPELNISGRMAFRFSLKSLIIFYFVCICAFLKHVCLWYPQKTSKGIQFPRTGVKIWLWMPCWCWGPGPDFLRISIYLPPLSHCSMSFLWKF